MILENTLKYLKIRKTTIYKKAINLKYIQKFLGHVHSKSTEIYTHVSTKDLGDGGEKEWNYMQLPSSPLKNIDMFYLDKSNYEEMKC